MPYKNLEKRKQKQKEYSAKHYRDNKNNEKIRIDKTKKEKRAEWNAFKGSLSCSNCGFSHVAALDFHHLDPKMKEDNVHQFVSDGKFAKAYEEIKKCIVLCSNCHRILHYNERMIKKARRSGQIDYSYELIQSNISSSESSNNQTSSSAS